MEIIEIWITIYDNTNELRMIGKYIRIIKLLGINSRV